MLSLPSSLLPTAASVYTFNDPIHRHVNTHNIASDQGTQFIRKLGGGAVYLITRKQLLSENRGTSCLRLGFSARLETASLGLSCSPAGRVSTLNQWHIHDARLHKTWEPYGVTTDDSLFKCLLPVPATLNSAGLKFECLKGGTLPPESTTAVNCEW